VLDRLWCEVFHGIVPQFPLRSSPSAIIPLLRCLTKVKGLKGETKRNGKQSTPRPTKHHSTKRRSFSVSKCVGVTWVASFADLAEVGCSSLERKAE
jgi:hypothetical protein